MTVAVAGGKDEERGERDEVATEPVEMAEDQRELGAAPRHYLRWTDQEVVLR
ncbi:hypothetical protein [Bradyrhizobium yuanmingense]|uniref:hypothetical protein n=1 Tax=Bradyrhizobium yuanmingense TaxID=108015 RepID=UPI001FD16A12|nr:hypothetical protein [Bradyrhizobium yuanmingense]